MTTKNILIIALFFLASVPLFAQKTNGHDLYISSAIVNILRKNTAILPKNSSIMVQKSFYTEGSSFRKIQLQLDKKTAVGTFDFPLTFVIGSHKKSTADGRTVIKYLSVFGHFDTDRGAGGGLTMTY